jgi:hypothetical protein
VSKDSLEADAFWLGRTARGAACADFFVAFKYNNVSCKVASAVKRLTCKNLGLANTNKRLYFPTVAISKF